jgi:DNA-binding CsgD family transcriptional regulator
MSDEIKKLRSMSEVSAAEAVEWFDNMFNDPEGYWTEPPSWFAEVNARDFMECWKMHNECRTRENLSDWQLQPLTEQQKKEINAMSDEDFKEVGVTPEEIPAIRLWGESKSIKEIAADLKKDHRTVATQIRSARSKLEAAGYKVSTKGTITKS